MTRPSPTLDRIKAELPTINKLIAQGWKYNRIQKHLGINSTTWNTARQMGIITKRPVTKNPCQMAQRHGVKVGKINMHSMSDEAIAALAAYAHRNGIDNIAEAMQEIALEAWAEGRLDA